MNKYFNIGQSIYDIFSKEKKIKFYAFFNSECIYSIYIRIGNPACGTSGLVRVLDGHVGDGHADGRVFPDFRPPGRRPVRQVNGR